MKKAFKMMFIALLTLSMFACGEKKLTFNDMKKAEATLFKEDGSLDTLKVPGVVEKYCQFVKQNPTDSTASLWLYHAMELNVMLRNVEKSKELCDQLTEQYPDSKWTPRGLYILGSFIYEDELKDLDKAEEIYDRILADYPDCDVIKSVEASKRYLGWPPEKIMADIQLQQFQEGPTFIDTIVDEE